MDSQRLQKLFIKYIEKFEYINNPTNDESYKWEVVQMFQDRFDLDTPDESFAEMLETVWKGTYNLIDNKSKLPFYALVDYAKKEPGTVRELFRALFQEDNGDLTARQQRINQFIAATEELRIKYSPTSWKYENDQRSVLAYLFLHAPEENYLFKSTQAHEFADCVEFYDDWGSGSNFKLDVYYRMCDELVAAMKVYQPLLDTNASRFEGHETQYYKDHNLHILAFDLIYSSQVYSFYDGIPTHLNTQAKKLYLERVEKARTLQAAVESARETVVELREVTEHLLSITTEGSAIFHRSFGKGKVAAVDGGRITICFENCGEKTLFFYESLSKGYLKYEVPEYDSFVQEHASLLNDSGKIPERLKKAEEAFAPYRELLE